MISACCVCLSTSKWWRRMPSARRTGPSSHQLPATSSRMGCPWIATSYSHLTGLWWPSSWRHSSFSSSSSSLRWWVTVHSRSVGPTLEWHPQDIVNGVFVIAPSNLPMSSEWSSQRRSCYGWMVMTICEHQFLCLFMYLINLYFRFRQQVLMCTTYLSLFTYLS